MLCLLRHQLPQPGEVQKLVRTLAPQVSPVPGVLLIDDASAFALNQTKHRNQHLFTFPKECAHTHTHSTALPRLLKILYRSPREMRAYITFSSKCKNPFLNIFLSPSCLPTLAPTGISLSCPGAMPRLLHSPLIPCSFLWSLNPSSPRGLHKFLSMYDAERFSNPFLPFGRHLEISSSTSVYLLKGSFHMVQCISKDNSAE